ncbi:hypothetical protein HWV62_43066 [Athelia sp. TMB]|nr:hypothetical protein HWV62_43066 [Athelia sp. TMB]
MFAPWRSVEPRGKRHLCPDPHFTKTCNVLAYIGFDHPSRLDLRKHASRHTQRNTQSRLASLRGSLRSSTLPLTRPSQTITRSLGRHFSAGFIHKAHPPTPEAIPVADWVDDFEQITPDDLSGLVPDIPPTHSVPTSTTPPSADTLVRRPSVFTRLKKFSRTSTDHHPTPTTPTPISPRTRHNSQPKLRAELSTLCLDFPQPPTHIPTPPSAHASKRHSGPPVLGTPIADARCDPGSEFLSSIELGYSPIEIPSSPIPSFQGTGGRSRSLKRIKAFTKEALRATVRTPVSEVSAAHPPKSKGTRTVRGLSVSKSTPIPQIERSSPEPPPAVFLDSAELTASPVATAFPDRSCLSSSSQETIPAPSQESSLELARQLTVTTLRGPFAPAFAIPPPIIKYEFVNPADLTPSPFSFSSSSLQNSTRTSFIPPSPSWLSRNVPVDEPYDFRSVLPSPSQGRTPYLFDLERLVPSPIESIFEYDYPHPSELFRPDSPPPIPIPPPVIFAVPPPPPHQLRIEAPYVAIENPAQYDSYSDTQSVSDSTLTTESCPASPNTSFLEYIYIAAMNFYGKTEETVDFGGEVDYADYQWFKDAPPRQEAPPTVQPAEAYVPLPSVIEQNELFEFALKAAPNVLYSRYKQYGQLGVLAWCSEFGEMIDTLKDLGFHGNMFVTTRKQALATCEELLRLKLDIKMQIIVMYLSSQVARLRRFLDGDRVFDDYPIPEFPLEPRNYQ